MPNERWLAQRVRGGDFTLRGLVAELAERGLKVDYRAVWAFVHVAKLSFKKTVVAGERARRDVARRRAQWVRCQRRVEASRLVFLDETWTKTNMAPLRGWGPRGARVLAQMPHRRWLIDGPIDGEGFATYVEQVLSPTLKRGDLVIMDNLGSHRGARVRQAIRAKGAKLFFLPNYSPHLNPIEQVFAKLKHLLRKAQAMPSAPPSASSSAAPPPRNAPPTSRTQAMHQPNTITL